MKDSGDEFNVDEILNRLFQAETLIDLFEKRLKELDIPPTNALEILDIQYRALNGILTGTNRRVDFVNFNKIANFLNISREDVLKLYFKELEKNFLNEEPYPVDKEEFIKKNFDLATLRKAGFISSITDYKSIEAKIIKRFGLKNIFEYAPVKRSVAFSSGSIKPKTDLSRQFWLTGVIEAFEKLDNKYKYDRDELIKYIPSIRWHCTNVNEGLHFVIRDLFRLGISVIYQSPLSNLHLRGATLIINDRPCIVLTDYKGFYPTIWFALIHELFHVLFDFDEIRDNLYHITNDETEDLRIKEKERHANEFARKYFFSKEKSDKVAPHITNKRFVTEFAAANDVHPSFIYVFYAMDTGDETIYKKRNMWNPDYHSLIAPLDYSWSSDIDVSAHINNLKKSSIYK